MEPSTHPPEPVDELRPAHGHVEHVDFDRSSLSGWIFLPDVAMDKAEVQVDGESVGVAELVHYPKVAAAYNEYEPFNQRIGYSLQVDHGSLGVDRSHQISVVGYRDGRPVAKMKSIVLSPTLIPDVPIPPPRLIELTQGDHDVHSYRMLGYRYYQQIRELVARHRNWNSVRRVFDWGCGSGRIASFVMKESDAELYGGDMNHDAVAWCQEYLKPGHFRALHPLPPLPYADETFDLILSIGVVGGCGPAEYAVWLPELRRVLAPTGLMVVSVQGRFAAEVLYPREALVALERDGTFDGTAYDKAFPPDPSDKRYRGGMYLSRDYVACTWAPHFRILEHLEGELNSDLDLVLVQRR